MNVEAEMGRSTGESEGRKYIGTGTYSISNEVILDSILGVSNLEQN